MGLFDSDNTAAELARQAKADEDARQARVMQGMKQLDALFGGGTMGVNPLDPKAYAFNPNKTYYDVAGNPIDWVSDTPSAPTISSDTTGYQGIVNAIVNAKGMGKSEVGQRASMGDVYADVGQSKFNEDFYNKAYEAQKAYELPQVERQYQDAQRQLGYGLARQGLSHSTQAGGLNARLVGDNVLAVNDAEEHAGKARSDLQQSVLDEKNSLVQMLNATGDNTSTLNDARARASLLQQSRPLQEVGPVFQNATASLADMIVSPAVRLGGSGGGGGYGGNSRGSGKVIGT